MYFTFFFCDLIIHRMIFLFFLRLEVVLFLSIANGLQTKKGSGSESACRNSQPAHMHKTKSSVILRVFSLRTPYSYAHMHLAVSIVFFLLTAGVGYANHLV